MLKASMRDNLAAGLSQEDAEKAAVQSALSEAQKELQEIIDAAFAELPALAERAKAANAPSPEINKAKADFNEALGELGDIFSKNTRLNMIPPEQEAKLLPVLTKLMDAAFRMGYHKFKAASRYVINRLREAMPAVAKLITIDYLQGAYIAMAARYKDKGADTKKDVVAIESIEEIEQDDQPAPKPSNTLAPPTIEGPFVNMQLFSEAESAFVNEIMGRMNLASDKPPLRNIVEARNLYTQITGNKLEGADVKRIDELIELAVVLFAKDRINVARKGFNGKTPQQIVKAVFDLLAKVYETRQPNLNFRTSTSIEQQAYSTPMPLAYVASRLAGVETADKVYEPTAGNGMLLIEAKPENVIANELNPDRNKALRVQEFGDVHGKDAMTMNLGEKVDVVITNPPFGAVKDGETSRIFRAPTKQTPQGYFETTQIDHAIALKSLGFMKDDGRAVLIVGAPAKTIEDRKEGYRSKQKREFYLALYRDYNVISHHTVSGDLYKRQGAAWPVDLIVIEGRGASKLPLPAVTAPPFIASFEELGKLLEHSAQQRPANDGRGAIPKQDDDNQVAAPATPRPAPTGITGPVRGPRGGASTVGAGVSGTDGATTGSTGTDGTVRPQLDRPAGNNGRPQPSGSGTTGAIQPDGNTGGAGVSPTGTAGTGAIPSNMDGAGNGTPNQSRVGQETETEGQVTYVPGNSLEAIGTLIPANMRDATAAALKELESRVGPLHAYVATQLNYNPDGIGKYFSAEQVDALALAIDNIGKQAGFIIGDQTGIGKGRVNAGIIRWAIINKKTPIFFTHQPTLYKDIYRDLADIGMEDMHEKILMTNTDLKIPLDEDGTMQLKTDSKHRGLLRRLIDEGSLGNYQLIVTTYAQMSLIRGALNIRNELVRAFAPGGIIVMDESHNAGGSGKEKIVRGVVQLDRARFIRNLVDEADGVFYSSATYAKRPEVMDLYSKTDMRLAVPNMKKLGEAISAGGVPMQQVVAAMLATAGQYMRRERSFAGVTYDFVERTVDKRIVEAAAEAMREIIVFDDMKKAALTAIKDDLAAEGQAIGHDSAAGSASAHSENFTSIMHNLVSQLLLGLKVPSVVDSIKTALAENKKPVVTVANTMESMLDRYTTAHEIKFGEPIEASFADLFERYLERSREISIKRPWTRGDAEKRRLTDAELGPRAVAQFERTLTFIRDTDWGALPFSPIDYLHNEIRKLGLKSGEITGRETFVEYSGEAPTYRKRPAKEVKSSGRIATLQKYNNGEIDVMIINQSGSTGISAHASPKVGRDTRKRHMIVAQAELNIDIHMQLLGRVHRTGQIVTPSYEQLVADVPAENRPAAVLLKKMASLNANTTGARKGGFMSDKVLDFMNQYGDEVIANIMWDNPEIHAVLGEPLLPDEGGVGFIHEGAARKVTGRIPVLRLVQQREIYDVIRDEYVQLLEQKTALGENALEAKTLPLDAKAGESVELFQGIEGNPSPFAQSAQAVEMNVKRLGKPMTTAQVLTLAAESLGLDPADHDSESIKDAGTYHAERALKEVKADFDRWLDNELATYEDEAVRTRQEGRFRIVMDKLTDAITNLSIGQTVEIIQPDGSVFFGAVINMERKGIAKNPAANGAWKVKIALADAAREVTLPVSKITLAGEEGLTVVRPQYTGIDDIPIMDLFDRGQSDSREKRVIVTGNILAGFSRIRGGQIINFTNDEGKLQQGVLMPRSFNITDAETMAAQELMDPQAALAEFNKGNVYLLHSDGDLRVRAVGDTIQLTVPSAKAKGQKFFQNPDLINAIGSDFYKKGSTMVGRFTSQELLQVLTVLYSKFPGLYFVSMPDVRPSARYSLGEGDRKIPPANERAILEALADIVEQLAPGANVKVVDTLHARDEDAKRSGGTGTDTEAAGAYIPSLEAIKVSLSFGDPTVTLRHEILHYLKDIGLITAREWRVLTAQSKATWMKRFNVPDVEEGIAYAFQRFKDANEKQALVVQRVFNRIRDFFRRLANALQGRGFQTWEDVFNRIESGEVGRRQRGKQIRAANKAIVDGIPTSATKYALNGPEFDDPATEKRWRDARHGLASTRTMLTKLLDTWDHVVAGFSRHYVNLPNIPEFSKAHEALRQFEAAPEAAKEEAVRMLREITADLTQAEYDIFSRKVVLDDFEFEASVNHKIPFGLPGHQVEVELDKINPLITPKIQTALDNRKQHIDRITKRLVRADILKKEQTKNPAYYRHQVLMYARERAIASSTPPSLKKPRSGYTMRREGTDDDINANYIEAEFEFLHRAMIDLKAAATIEKIRRDYDVKPDLVQRAKMMGIDEWRDLIPDGYEIWQPDVGNVFYLGHTIGEKAMDVMLDQLGTAGAIDPALVDLDALRDAVDSIKDALIVGGPKKQFVIPSELAATLRLLRPPAENTLFSKVFSEPMRWWKQWVLINPRRFLKYNINNMSGDLDAVLAGAPGVALKLPKAIGELWNIMYRNGKPSQLYLEAVERGVFDGGLTVQEIPDINWLRQFEHLIPNEAKPNIALAQVSKVWRALKDATRFRENWMRYAAYIYYTEQRLGGKTLLQLGYGAASPKLVNALTDVRDQNALLARQLIGDYGNVSHYGQDLRAKVIPFYSWMEINTGRYVRLIANGFRQGIVRGVATGSVLAVSKGAMVTAHLFVRMALMYAAVTAYNILVHGDDEEELSAEERARLHLLLGRDKDGKIRMLRFQGALSDFLAWFGFEQAIATMLEIEKGRASFADVAKAIAKAPINKIVGGLTPMLKTPMEMASGQTFWPDVFKPRQIRDRTRDLFRLFSFENEYDWLTGKPTRGYANSLAGIAFNYLDPEEAAYNRTRKLTFDYLRKTKGAEGVPGYSTATSRLVYEWRLAKKYGDKKAEAEIMKEIDELGINLTNAIKRAGPLGGLSKRDAAEFEETLSEKERHDLERAYRYHDKIYSD